MQIQDALDRFIVQLEADGRSPHTIAQYRRHVHAVEGWLRSEGRDTALDGIDHEVVAAFLSSPVARTRPDGGLKRATSTNALRSSIRVFLGYLRDAGYMGVNAGRLIRRAVTSPPPPRAIPEEELTQLLDAVGADPSPAAVRDHALFSLLARAGLRLGSALALDVGDLDLTRGEARLRVAKGDRRETVVLTRALCEILGALVAGTPADAPVFRAAHGGRLGQRQAQRRFAIWCERAGLSGYSAHSCRHSFACRLYALTGDLGLVQAAMTHRSIASTTVYAKVPGARLRAAIEG